MPISSRKSLATGVLFIIFIILAAAYIVTYNSVSGGHTKTTVPATTTAGTTSASTTIVMLTTTIPSYLSGGGPGSSYMSNAEASSLIGTAASYQGAQLTSAQVSSYMNNSIKGQPALGFLKDNVSAMWMVSARSSGGSLNEVVYQSSVSRQLYNFYIGLLDNGTYKTKSLNLTLNGLIYSYYQAGSGSGVSAYLIGIKNSEFAYLELTGTVSGKIQSAASIVANDTP